MSLSIVYCKNTANQAQSRNPLQPLYGACFNNNRLKTHFERNMRKPVQSAVVDTIGVDEMVTQDSATLAHLHAMISEESKDINFLSPPESTSKKPCLRQITDISSSSVKVSHKYEYPKYLSQSFSMGDVSHVEQSPPDDGADIGVIEEGPIETDHSAMDVPEEIPSVTVDEEPHNFQI